MKKVVLPFDGKRFPEAAFSFAATLNNFQPILLTGILLSQLELSKFFLVPPSISDTLPLLEENPEEESIEKNIRRFSIFMRKK